MQHMTHMPHQFGIIETPLHNILSLTRRRKKKKSNNTPTDWMWIYKVKEFNKNGIWLNAKCMLHPHTFAVFICYLSFRMKETESKEVVKWKETDVSKFVGFYCFFVIFLFFSFSSSVSVHWLSLTHNKQETWLPGVYLNIWIVESYFSPVFDTRWNSIRI